MPIDNMPELSGAQSPGSDNQPLDLPTAPQSNTGGASSSASKPSLTSQLFGDFTQKIKPATQEQKLTPVTFNWAKSGLDRFQQSSYFDEIGYNPLRDQQSDPSTGNEALYGYRQTVGNVLSNAIGGAFGLAKQTFEQGFEDYARIGSALVNWDADKLAPSAKEMEQLNKEQTDIFNKYAIFKTPESEQTFWNKQMFGDLVQQSGFTLGTMAQFALEEALLGGVGGVLLKSAGEIGKVAELGKVGKFLGRTTDRLKDVTESGIIEGRAARAAATKDIAAIGEQAYNPILKKLSGKALNLVPGKDIYEGWKQGQNIAQSIGIGLGSLRRGFAELNMANTEAIMEGSSTYIQTRDSMIDQYVEQHGENPDATTLQNIEKLAYEAGVDNTKFNDAILLAANRLAFDGLFNSVKANSWVSKVLPKTEGSVSKVTGKLEGSAISDELKGKTVTLAFEKGKTFKNLTKIYKEFGPKKASLEASKLLLDHLSHIEVSEGLQELTQNASNDYFNSLAYAKYDHQKNISFDQAFFKQLKNEDGSWNMDGIKTFMMGAGTGFIVNGPMHLIKAGFNKGRSAYDQRNMTEEQKQKANVLETNLQQLNEQIKGILADPASVLGPSIGALNTQKALQQKVAEATENKKSFDYHNIQNTIINELLNKAGSVGNTSLVTDYLDNIEKNFSQEDFEKAFLPGGFKSSKIKKSDYFDVLRGSVEGYLDTVEKLQEKIPDYFPERYKKNSKEYYDAQISQLARKEVIHTLASQRSAMLDAHNRIHQIYTSLADVKEIGGSLSQTAQILGSEKKTKAEIANLKIQLATLTSGQLDSIGRTRLSMVKKQLNALETWEDADKSENTKAGTKRTTYGLKAYKAYAEYLNLKNEESNITAPVTTDQVAQHFKTIKDYIELNRRKEDIIDAYDWLAAPKNHTRFMEKIATGLKFAELQTQWDTIEQQMQKLGFRQKNKDLYDEFKKLASVDDPSKEQVDRLFSLRQELADKAVAYSDEDQKEYTDKIATLLNDPLFKDANKKLTDRYQELENQLNTVDNSEQESQILDELGSVANQLFEKAANHTEEVTENQVTQEQKREESEFRKDFEKAKTDIQKIKTVEALDKYQSENAKIYSSEEEKELIDLFNKRKAEILKDFPIENVKFGTVIQNKLDKTVKVIGRVLDKGTKNESVILFDPQGSGQTGSPVFTKELVENWTPIHQDYNTYKPVKEEVKTQENIDKTKKSIADVTKAVQDLLESAPDTPSTNALNSSDPGNSVPLYVYKRIQEENSLAPDDIIQMVQEVNKKIGDPVFAALVPNIIFKLMSSPESLDESMNQTLDTLDPTKVKELARSWNPLNSTEAISDFLNPSTDLDVNAIKMAIFSSLFKPKPEIVEGTEIKHPEQHVYYLRSTGSETRSNTDNTIDTDPSKVRWYNTLRLIGSLQEKQRLPLSQLSFTTVEGDQVSGVQLLAVSALKMNRDYADHLDLGAQKWIADIKKKIGDDPQLLESALNRGAYIVFADKEGKPLGFNQEGLIDKDGKYAIGSLPSTSYKDGKWYASTDSGYRLPEEARAAQQEKLSKLDKLRKFLEFRTTTVPIIFEGVHEGNATFGENIAAISSEDKIELTNNGDGTKTLNKVDLDGTRIPLKAPTLNTKRDLLDSIFYAITHPESLKGHSIKGDGDDNTGHYNALTYASQFLNLSHGVDIKGDSETDATKNPKANKGFHILGIVKEKNNLRLKSYDDTGKLKTYSNLSNLSAIEQQEVRNLLAEQRIAFSTQALDTNSIRVYTLNGDQLTGEDLAYNQFLSSIGVGQRVKTENRKFNPSAVFDIDKVPEIPKKQDAVPQLETKKSPVSNEEDNFFEVESGADLSDFFPENNEVTDSISSGAAVSDFFEMENPSATDILTNPKLANPGVEKTMSNSNSSAYSFGDDFNFDGFDLPIGDSNDTTFDPTCK